MYWNFWYYFLLFYFFYFFTCYSYLFHAISPCLFIFSVLWETLNGISVELGIPTPLGSFRNSECCLENCQSGHHFPNHSSALHLIEIADSYTIEFGGVSLTFHLISTLYLIIGSTSDHKNPGRHK